MSMPRDHRVEAWFHSLRDAVGARNEPLYRRHVTEFLSTVEGLLFVQRNLNNPVAHGVMSKVYCSLVPELGLSSPEDLLERMNTLDRSGSAETVDNDASMGAVFLHYLRLGRDWSKTYQTDPSYGVALAALLFEPLLALFNADPESAPAAAEPDARARPAASFDRGTQFA
jgi:hypothetical protein